MMESCRLVMLVALRCPKEKKGKVSMKMESSPG